MHTIMEESTGLAPDPGKSVSLSRTTQYLDWFTLHLSIVYV